MRPILCSKFNPQYQKLWSALKLRYCILSFWKYPLVGIDLLIAAFLVVASSYGLFGGLGEVARWIGVLNLWRWGWSWFATSITSLSTTAEEETNKDFVCFYIIGHAPIALGLTGLLGGSILAASACMIGLLLVAKVVYLFHPYELIKL